MTESRFLPIGRIVKAHGLKGEVSVVPLTGLPFVLPENLRVWIVPPPATVREGVVQGVRPGPKGPLVKISGVDDIGTAQSLSGREIVARPEDLPEAWTAAAEEPGPVGMAVRLEDGSPLGEIVDVIETGANDVWVVRGEREVLLPAIPDVVLSSDYDTGVVVVRLLPGLIDED